MNEEHKKVWRDRLGYFFLLLLAMLVAAGIAGLLEPDLYPFERLAHLGGNGPEPVVQVLGQKSSDEPVPMPNERWEVVKAYRLSACDNRPGLKKVYVRALDADGGGLEDIKVRFGWAGGKGMAYDHPDIWGVTEGRGFLEWDHLGVPTVYSLYMEDDAEPLVTNMTTIGANEYCQPGSVRPWDPWGWRPVNRPGIYSFRVWVQRKE